MGNICEKDTQSSSKTKHASTSNKAPSHPHDTFIMVPLKSTIFPLEFILNFIL